MEEPSGTSLGHIGVRLGLALTGIRFRIVGAEHLPLDRAAIYCANTREQRGSPVLSTHSIRACISSTSREIDRIPVLARAFRLGGFDSH